MAVYNSWLFRLSDPYFKASFERTSSGMLITGFSRLADLHHHRHHSVCPGHVADCLFMRLDTVTYAYMSGHFRFCPEAYAVAFVAPGPYLIDH